MLMLCYTIALLYGFIATDSVFSLIFAFIVEFWVEVARGDATNFRILGCDLLKDRSIEIMDNSAHDDPVTDFQSLLTLHISTVPDFAVNLSKLIHELIPRLLIKYRVMIVQCNE